MDQITLLVSDVKLLEKGEARTVEELQQAGIVPLANPGEPLSYVQQVKKQQAIEKELARKMGKRERRRHEQKLLEEARARGEA